MLRTKNVLLKGKAGRGKSLFILCIILEILYCTKHNSPSLLCPSAGPFPTDPRILFIDRENNRHLVTLNEVTLLLLTPKVHYCFSDGVDLGFNSIGSLLTVAATSGDKEMLKQFVKRCKLLLLKIKLLCICLP